MYLYYAKKPHYVNSCKYVLKSVYMYILYVTDDVM